MESDNPTLGHKTFAIKSMGVFEVFWVILVKLDQQIDFSKLSCFVHVNKLR